MATVWPNIKRWCGALAYSNISSLLLNIEGMCRIVFERSPSSFWYFSLSNGHLLMAKRERELGRPSSQDKGTTKYVEIGRIWGGEDPCSSLFLALNNYTAKECEGLHLIKVINNSEWFQRVELEQTPFLSRTN